MTVGGLAASGKRPVPADGPAVAVVNRGTTKIRGVKVYGLVKDSGVSGYGAYESRPRA